MIRVKSFIIVPTGKIWEPASAKANVSLAFSNMQLKLPDCRILLAGFDEMENLRIVCFSWTSHSKDGASRLFFRWWPFLVVTCCFFLFVLNTNERLRWLGQKLLQTVGRGSMQAKERWCEPLLCQPDVLGTAGLPGPVWDCSLPYWVHEEGRTHRHLLLGVVTLLLSIPVHSHLRPTLVGRWVTAY